MDRRMMMAGAASLIAAGRISPVRAQGEAVSRLIFPFGAGGGGDTLCRLLAEDMRVSLGRAHIVENRVGADGLIGIRSVRASAPDGTTILITTGPTMYLLPMVEQTPSFDAARDFVPVSLLGRFEFGIVVGSMVPAKTFLELVAWLKSNPDRRSFGVPANGTIPHFTGSVIEKQLGMPMIRVPYRGGAPVMNDLVGGHLPFGIITTADALPHHHAGRLRIIAICSDKRSPGLPEVATLKENGINLVTDAYYGMWLPAGAPPALAEKLSAACHGAVTKPEIAQKLQAIGIIPVGSSPAGLADEIAKNIALWRPIVEATGFKIST